MSENLLIKEGQIGRKFSPVDRLRVNNQGGGSSLWRNAEELEMDSLEVTENGLYLALDEDLYAYDTITVDVQEASDDEKKAGKTIVGKDPTTGDDHAIGVDEDGNLTEERIPDAIEITVVPKKFRYVTGEEIDFRGIVVYLKYQGGVFTSEEYPTGEIPFEELVFPDTTAEGGYISYDGSSQAVVTQGGTIEIASSNTVYEGSAICTGYYVPSFDIEDQPGSQYDYWGYTFNFVWASRSPFKIQLYNGTIRSAYSYTVDGDTFYFCSTGGASWYPKGQADIRTVTCTPGRVLSYEEYQSQEEHKIAHDLLEGEGKMEVRVQWIRPQDGEVLQDSFEIEVYPEKPLNPDREPEPDPYSDHYDFEYQGAKYNYNRSDIRGMSFSGGYVLVTYMDTMQMYTVADALKYNLIVRVSSTHSGGDF